MFSIYITKLFVTCSPILILIFTDYGGEKRPRTAPGTADGNVNFTIRYDGSNFYMFNKLISLCDLHKFKNNISI